MRGRDGGNDLRLRWWSHYLHGAVRRVVAQRSRSDEATDGETDDNASRRVPEPGEEIPPAHVVRLATVLFAH